MTDRPIIFSGPMVNALLAGRKTQTRRVLKLNGRFPDFIGPRGCENDPTCWGWEDSNHGDFVTLEKEHGQRMGWRDWRGAYAPGDRLYVREAWRTMDGQDGFSGAQIEAQCREAGYRRAWSPIWYEADGTRENWIADPHTFGTKPGRYRHARHMPRWASRMTLTVTAVRVQRVQDISEADALAEGVGHVYPAVGLETGEVGHRRLFELLWNSLHGPDAWGANPWVAALTFTAHHRNIDQMEAK